MYIPLNPKPSTLNRKLIALLVPLNLQVGADRKHPSVVSLGLMNQGTYPQKWTGKKPAGPMIEVFAMGS